MTINHNEFLEFARNQLDCENPTEIQLRNAASRSYYALYHKALQRLTDLQVSVEKAVNAGAHESLIRTFQGMGPREKIIATMMHNLKRYRHTCDYSLDSTIVFNRTQKHVAEVERVIDMIDRIELQS